MALAVSGTILTPSGFRPGAVIVEQGKIAAVTADNLPDEIHLHETHFVAPGFIDLQVNGGFGRRVEDGSEAIAAIGSQLPASGVTAFLPTVVSSTIRDYRRILSSYAQMRVGNGARPLGLHLEGPVLSPQRAGAHVSTNMTRGDVAEVVQILGDEHVMLATVAPEIPTALPLISSLVTSGITVSLGHTNASFAEFEKAVDAGATMATHLFNAMSEFHHRQPGAAGAALVDSRVTAGMIADGLHSDPAALELAYLAKGWERIALVTDMVECAGMPEGAYQLGGLTIESRGGAVRLEDGTLAGSTLSMDAAVRNMERWTSATREEALRMASEVPARVLGLTDRGRIEAGARADLVLLDHDLMVTGTLIEGEWAYRSAA